MDSYRIRAWLEKKLKAARTRKLARALASLIAGLAVMFGSFWLTYAVIWAISQSFFPLGNWVALLIAAGFMTLVVIVGAKQNMADLNPLERQVRTARAMDITLSSSNRYGMSYKTDAAKAAAFRVLTIASVVNYVLCGGVKLVFGSVGVMRQAEVLKQVDAEGCARVLEILHAGRDRVSFEEIREALPWITNKTFDDLHFVEGVSFLSNEPAGLALYPELKEELDGLR